MSASKVAQELQTVRTAHADTLAELHQVTEQSARELANRTCTILEREATIALLQEQAAERVRAQLAAIRAEAASSAAKANEADAKCASLIAKLAAAEETIRLLQVRSQELDVSAELGQVKAALATEM